MIRATIIALSVCIVAATSAQSAEPWQLPLTQEVKLLSGRLMVNMPQSAKVEPREYDIMSAPEATESETRVVIESHSKKIVLLAQELHAYAGSNLSKNVNSLVNTWQKQSGSKYTCSTQARSKDNFRLIYLQDKKGRNQSGDVRLVNGVIVASKDGTAQYLSLYVNEAGAKDWTQLLELSKRILGSVRAGKATPNLKSRKVFVDEGVNLAITLPPSSMVSTQRGPDFILFCCFLLKELDCPKVAMTIYSGTCPNYEPTKMKPDRESIILDQKVRWYKNQERGLEALVHVPKDRNQVLHIMLGDKTEAETVQLLKVLGTMKVK